MIPPRIETHIVDPPASPGVLEASRGSRIAAASCGAWPTAAGLADYLTAVDRAEREAHRAGALLARWRRRFARNAGGEWSGPARAMTRYHVALALAEQRSECLRLLTGPAAGAA